MEEHQRDVHFQSAEQAGAFESAWNELQNQARNRAIEQVQEYTDNNQSPPEAVAADFQGVEAELIVDAIEDGATDDGDDEDSKTKINLLMDIVSGSDLPVGDIDGSTDPYVVVQMQGKELHRTKHISNKRDPIWTLKTKSLFLLS